MQRERAEYLSLMVNTCILFFIARRSSEVCLKSLVFENMSTNRLHC